MRRQKDFKGRKRRKGERREKVFYKNFRGVSVVFCVLGRKCEKTLRDTNNFYDNFNGFKIVCHKLA